jgi:hypothetical protein
MERDNMGVSGMTGIGQGSPRFRYKPNPCRISMGSALSNSLRQKRAPDAWVSPAKEAFAT